MSRSFFAILFFLANLTATTGCSEATFESEDKLATEKTILEEQEKTVQTLKKQIEIEQRRADTAIPFQIDNEQSQIGALGDVISQVREAQSEISNAGTEALNRETLLARQVQNQVIPQIQNIQQTISRTDEQITLLTSIGLRSKEQETRLRDLKNQLAEQNSSLESLQAQLNSFNLENITTTTQIYRSVQDQRRELASYRDDIQTELDSRREDLATLQTFSLQSRMSLMTLNQQLKNAEQALKAQAEKVHTIESQNK